MRVFRPICLALLALAIVAPAARAVDPNEPNDTIAQATGPISDGVLYHGEATSQIDDRITDIDLYKISVPLDNEEVHLAFSYWAGFGAPGACDPDCSVGAALIDGTGNGLGYSSEVELYSHGEQVGLDGEYHARIDFTVGKHADILLRVAGHKGSVLTPQVSYEFTLTRAGGTQPPVVTTPGSSTPTGVTPAPTPMPTGKRPSQSGPNKRCLRALGKMRSAKRVVKRRQRAYRRHPTRTRRLALSGAKQRVAIWRAFVRTYC